MPKNCVLITGSAKGLGKALAFIFSKNNYNVILSDIDKKNIEKVQKEILKNSVNCKSLVGDLRDKKIIKKLKELAVENDVNVLINNAGIHCPHLAFEEMSQDQIEDILDTNLIAPIKLTQEIYKYFIDSDTKGTIININSLSGLKNHFHRTIYSSSKWGLRGFSESLKLESGEKHIRILDIYPSRIKTQAQFKDGMEPKFVAQKIYDAFKNTGTQHLEIDGR